MLMKCIELDEIIEILIDTAKTKNLFHIRAIEEGYEDMNCHDYYFYGMWNLIKKLRIPHELIIFEADKYYSDDKYSESFIIEKIVVDGKEFVIETVPEILSLIEIEANRKRLDTDK